MILVTGDVIVGENFYEGRRTAAGGPDRRGSYTRLLPGGALLAYELLTHLKCAPRFGLEQNTVEKVAQLDAPEFHRRAVWKAVEHKGHELWALDRHLGYGTAKEPGTYPCGPARGLDNDVPEILLINDENLGFRDERAQHCWPEFLKRDRPPKELKWIVVRTSRPLARGKLWQQLTRDEWCKRLIVVTSADQLRDEGSRLAGGLSWETAVDDIVDELANPDLLALRRCQHLLVCMRSEAILWADQTKLETPNYFLVFDRDRCEGEWDEENRKLGAYGYLSVIASAVVAELSEHLDDPVLSAPLAAGLSATRRLYELGHGAADKPPTFPYDEVAKHLKGEIERTYAGRPSEHEQYEYAVTEVRIPSQKSGKWTILGQLSPWHVENDVISYEPARCLAIGGKPALPAVPCARFGQLLTMDRQEIDSLRTFRQLILMYRNSPDAKKPLCLGVFGAPGSGKSFGLKQIAEGVLGDKRPLEFNLTQFATPADLNGAFHQVRDRVLEGIVPIVFFDEFDTKRLEWLASFLAPMQDGTFQQGPLTHFLGKCVFVFAGGLYTKFEEFRSHKGHEEEAFKALKGPDFISRLAGFMDVPGPNPREQTDSKAAPKEAGPGKSKPKVKKDTEYPVRRALLIRSALGLKDEKLEIEPVLLVALLKCKGYRNGARSLQKLVLHIKQLGGFPLRRAYLPPTSVLGLYVEDLEEFHSWTKLYAQFRSNVANLAPIIHEDYRASLTAEQKASRPYAVPWEKLPSEVKEDNMAAAMRIPEILDWAGYSLVPAKPEEVSEPIDTTGMAAAEHGGWEEQKRIHGWFRGERNDKLHRHPLLIPYDQLNDDDKNLDRNTIRKYPGYVKNAGLRIVKKPPTAPSSK